MAMSEAEVDEMQRKIDEGIHLAQERLIERARHNHTTLVVAQGDRIVEVTADELISQQKNSIRLPQ